MVRFYGLGYSETLQLPLKTFWMFSKNIDRLSAEEDLRNIRVAGAVQSGETFEKMSTALTKQLGKVIVYDEGKRAMEEAVYDREGLLRLKGKGRTVR